MNGVESFSPWMFRSSFFVRPFASIYPNAVIRGRRLAVGDITLNSTLARSPLERCRSHCVNHCSEAETKPRVRPNFNCMICTPALPHTC